MHPVHRQRYGGQGRPPDDAEETGQRNLLEHAYDGSRSRYQRFERSPDLACARTQAASNLVLKLSNDPNFTEKLEAIVALYLQPAEHAIVLCVNEKSQVQALDRTQPGLPIKKAVPKL